MQYVFKKKIWVILAFIFDAIGYIVFSVLRLFRKIKPVENPGRILVIRLDHIGDLIMSTAVLKPLREKYPRAVIDFMVPALGGEVVGDNPYVSGVIKFDPPWFRRGSSSPVEKIKALASLTGILKAGRYDVIIDLRGDVRHILAMFFSGAKTRISYGITGGGFLLTHNLPYIRLRHETRKNLMLLEPLGIKAADPEMKIFFTEKDIKRSEILKSDAGIIGPYAVIHAVPGHTAKKWSADNFSEVTRYIRDIKRLLPVFIGAEEDRRFIQDIMGLLNGGVVDVSGKTDLKASAKLIEGASLFIGLDSGPAHMAACTGTPAVVLFSGVHDKRQWAPEGDNIRILCPGLGKQLVSLSSGEVCDAVDEIIGMNITGGNRI